MNKRRVRLSIKGIILKDNALLCLKHQKDGSIYYTLPGGGQEWGETITEAVKRECLEEANVVVQPNEVLFIRDYIAKNHEFSNKEDQFHQVEIMINCTLLEELDYASASQPDSHQIGIEWISATEINTIPLYPKILKEKITGFLNGGTPLGYIGDVN